VIPDSLYAEFALNADDFDDGPTAEWVKANRARLDALVEAALFRAFCMVESRREITRLDVGYDGVSLQFKREHYAKCCLVDTEYLDVDLKWADLLGETDPIKAAWEAKREAERKGGKS
jgi:hypothetical protein